MMFKGSGVVLTELEGLVALSWRVHRCRSTGTPAPGTFASLHHYFRRQPWALPRRPWHKTNSKQAPSANFWCFGRLGGDPSSPRNVMIWWRASILGIPLYNSILRCALHTHVPWVANCDVLSKQKWFCSSWLKDSNGRSESLMEGMASVLERCLLLTVITLTLSSWHVASTFKRMCFNRVQDAIALACVTGMTSKVESFPHTNVPHQRLTSCLLHQLTVGITS